MVGIKVVSLDTGASFSKRTPRNFLRPASNMKLYTSPPRSIVCLRLSFVTLVYAQHAG
jgi:D-alanyl-D-alanine carboxypeptidase